MKILLDLGHPAHIHYFKNFVKIMKEKGHEFAFVARDKEVLHTLLNHYNISYTSRGKGKKSLLGKLFYILYADYVIYKVAKKFKPDIFLSFASTYAAHVSRIFGKPHIALDDTEHAKFELIMYPPFTDVIINPASFWKNFSEKQLFLNTFMELCYLHPRYFNADPSVLTKYNVNRNRPFFIIRFVSWDASHDLLQKGLSYEVKFKIIELLKEVGDIIISSESKLPLELEKYNLKINPAHLHDLIGNATLYIGEGATTASECVMLGTPAIYINSLNAGTLQEQSDKYGLISLRSSDNLFEVLKSIFSNIELAKKNAMENRIKLLSDKIDCTAFLVWFIENYPESEKIIRKNPDYQYNFK